MLDGCGESRKRHPPAAAALAQNPYTPPPAGSVFARRSCAAACPPPTLSPPLVCLSLLHGPSPCTPRGITRRPHARLTGRPLARLTSFSLVQGRDQVTCHSCERLAACGWHLVLMDACCAALLKGEGVGEGPSAIFRLQAAEPPTADLFGIQPLRCATFHVSLLHPYLCILYNDNNEATLHFHLPFANDNAFAPPNC